MAAIESPLDGAIGMANELMPAPAPKQQGGGGGSAPHPSLNPLQFGKFLGGGGGEAAGGAEAGLGAAVEELAPLALAL